MERCQHSLTIHECWVCRGTNRAFTLREAWEVYNSKSASYSEWSEAAETFYISGHNSQAEYCTIRAIDSLVRLHGQDVKSFKNSFAIFVENRLSAVTTIYQGRVNQKLLIRLLNDIKFGVWQTKEHRRARKENFAILKPAYDALKETTDLLGSKSRWDRPKLASRFRKFVSYQNSFRWNKPELSVALMDETLASTPTDLVALTMKASALGDLGNWDSAKQAIESALEIDSRNSFSLIVYGRILLGMGWGFKAWDPLYEAIKIEFKIPVAAMLMTSCGVARLEEGLTPTQLKTLSDRRNYISNILQEFTYKEDFKGDVNLELLSLQMLISDGKFVEAIIFVRELEREQWLDRPDYWNWEIDNSIKRAGLSPSQVRFEAEKRQGDFFPNKPSA